MTEEIRRTPDQWCAMMGITVMDPDGWDRTNLGEDWEKRLTADEFNEKLMFSTIRWDNTGEH